VLRVLEPALRMKAHMDSNSRGQRERERGKRGRGRGREEGEREREGGDREGGRGRERERGRRRDWGREKRRERLHIGECRGTRKPVIPWVRVGSGFYSLFLYCLRAEMPFRCKQSFPRVEKCLLDLLWSVLHQCEESLPSQTRELAHEAAE
jgi:hypothetical protein